MLVQKDQVTSNHLESMDRAELLLCLAMYSDYILTPFNEGGISTDNLRKLVNRARREYQKRGN